MKGFEKILNLLLPRKCAGCGAKNEIFCDECRASSKIGVVSCLLCGFRNKTGEFCAECKKKFRPALKSVVWTGRYDGELKKAIWALKYGKRKETAKPLGEMLAEKFLVNHKNSQQPQHFTGHAYSPAGELLFSSRHGGTAKDPVKYSSADNFLVIPIPLHFKRQYERGFNQAELLAVEFAKITGFPISTNILQKIKETPAQVEVQDKELRLKNLENAFQVNVSSLGDHAEAASKWPKIILIDDVSTSGATLMHAASALKNAGAKEIIGLVVAHG